jgi:catechol 2,3-dioxygenase-like lactoylglutathione lyase family enzyme
MSSTDTQSNPRSAALDAAMTDAIVHPTLMVGDLDRAVGFYEKLGLRVCTRPSTGVFMTTANGSILALIHRPGVTPPSHTAAALQVDDLPAVVAALRANGVVLEEYDSPGLRTVDAIADMGDYSAAWVRDPDGNYIGLHDPPRA